MAPHAGKSLAAAIVALVLVADVWNEQVLRGCFGYSFCWFHRERTMEFTASFYGVEPFLGFSDNFCRRGTLPQVAEVEAAGLERVHVAYASDASNFPGLLSSMLSVSRHLGEPAACSIHVIVAARDMLQMQRLVGCFRRELLAELPAVPEVVLHMARNSTSGAMRAWSSGWLEQHPRFKKGEAWERLHLPEYLPGVRRAIWLDTDTIVRSDIAPLYRMRMKHAVAAQWSIPSPYLECFRKHPDIPQVGHRSWAFNSGVMVVDLERWRAEKIAEETEKWSVTLHGCFGDQLAMNYALRGNFDLLPWSWHVQGLGVTWVLMSMLPCIEHADILHWCGYAEKKPWMHSRSTLLDHLVEPYTPREQCEALSEDLPALYRGRSTVARDVRLEAGVGEVVGPNLAC